MNKNYFYTLGALLSVFLILILILSYCFRISTDDYFYISEVERIGTINIVTTSYLKWSGRYAAFTVLNSIFEIFKTHSSYFFLVPLCTFIILIGGIYKVISTLSSYYKINFDFIQTGVLSIAFLALLFFLSFDIGETWFWCASMAGYLFCIVAFIWGMYFILQPTSNLFVYVMVVICFLYIGGSSEVYSPIFLLIFLSIELFHFKQFRRRLQDDGEALKRQATFVAFIKNALHRKVFIAYVSLGIAFTILIVAPGNYMRDALFPPHRFFFSFFITAKSLVKFFIIYLPLHFHYIVAFSTVFMLAGNRFRRERSIRFNLTFFSFFKKITWGLITLLGLFFYMIAFIMSETGPARIWFLCSFLFSVYCCSISFYAGYCGLFSLKQMNWLKSFSLFATGAILSYSIVSQSTLATNYAKMYDLREQQLLKWKEEIERDTIVVVPALPKPGMLYTAEITSDTSHHTNRHLRAFYKLKFHVVKN